MTTIIGISVSNRKETATKVQEILTEFGCDIKTRLGLNDYNENSCTYNGLILVDMPKRKKAIEMINELKAIENVTVKEMEF